jgi:succinyl-diaminopimelate desuccinylase
MTDVVAHAQSLIRCKSVTPHEGGALRYLEGELTRAGFTCDRLPFGAPGTPEVDNLYARIGTSGPHVCFAGHTDVVPPGDEAAWRHPPFAAEIQNGVLFGRGAADMKGGVAAALAGTLRYLASNGGRPNGSISFLITADEEGPAINGTKKVVDWLIARGERPDYCLLGECTSEDAIGDTVKIGRRGSLSGTLTVRGVQGHVAYPHKAKNPLPRLIDALDRLRAQPLDAGNAHFQPSNLEITSIDTGNTTHNLIPASSSARFNIRFNDHHTGDKLKAWIDSQISTALQDTGISYALSYEPVSESFITEPAGFVQTLVAAIEAEAQRKPVLSTGGGTSDARFIKDLCPVVEIGLLNGTAHKIDECVSVSDLETLTRIFTRFLHLTLDAAH